jgi:predicted amidohydrolase YtcJ
MHSKAFWLIVLLGFQSFLMIENSLSQSQTNTADTVIFNAQILQKNKSFATAIAIKDQKILAVGNDAIIQKYSSANTQKINAHRKLIIPGLIDSHIHAIRAGLSYQSEVSWMGVTSIQKAIERIQVAAKQKPAGSWIIIAGGWVPEQFKDGIIPSPEQLLSAAGHHPLYIQKLYSSVFVSPGGLEDLGVSTNAELLSRLEVATDKSGHVTGWLNGNARAISDLFDFLPQPTPNTRYESTKLFFRELNRLGITGVIDPGGYNFPLESYEVLWRLHSENALSIRVAYSLSAPHRDTELDDFQKIIRTIPKDDAFLRWNGIGENVTWGMYNNESPTSLDQQKLQSVLEWAAKEKITVTLHWNNNESVSHLLDVIERVQVNYSIKDLRWSIAHLNNIDEKTLTRMQSQNIGWLVQNALYFQARTFEGKYGLDAIMLSPRIRQAINLNIPIGFGTDAHRVMDFNPFVAIEWLISGKSIDGQSGRKNPQLLTRLEAVSLYTQGSAYFLPDAVLRGDLSVGKYADLAILNQNIFTIPIHLIHKTHSELTMIGGKIMFASDQFLSLDKK